MQEFLINLLGPAIQWTLMTLGGHMVVMSIVVGLICIGVQGQEV